jgi:hypothetical protein
MTLKEKILSDNYLEDYDNPITDYQAEKIVERADDYAIEFAKWCLISLLNGEEPKAETPEELLEIFKKSKGYE